MAQRAVDTRIESEIDFQADGKQAGFLRLPYSQHRSAYGWIPIPITSIKNGEGPSVLLMAGNHGDEFEGQIVLSRLARELDPDQVRGRVVILPMANQPAAKAGLRTSPLDGGNLNRSFPGKAVGTPTEMIAHYIEHVLVAQADVLLDLHSAGSSLMYLPSMIMPWRHDDPANGQKQALLRAMGLPYALLHEPLAEDWLSSGAAGRQNAQIVTVEMSGAGMIRPDDLTRLEQGVIRTMAHLGAYSGPAEPMPESGPRLLAIDPKNDCFAREAGLFEPLAELGQEVEAGQPAGVIHFPESPLREPAPVAFEQPGFVICRRVPPRVECGDCLYQVATDFKSHTKGSQY